MSLIKIYFIYLQENDTNRCHHQFFKTPKNPYTLILAISYSVFSPDHLVDDTDIRLDDLYDLGGDILVGVVGDGDAVVAVGGHPNRELDGLQEPPGVDAAEYEAPLVEGLGPLGARPDADSRDGPADGRVERALLREGAAVAHDREGVHLKAVVVMEAERLVADDPRVEPEPA